MSLTLDEAKLTAQTITTALPYIQRYKDKLIVINLKALLPKTLYF